MNYLLDKNGIELMTDWSIVLFSKYEQSLIRDEILTMIITTLGVIKLYSLRTWYEVPYVVFHPVCRLSYFSPSKIETRFRIYVITLILWNYKQQQQQQQVFLNSLFTRYYTRYCGTIILILCFSWETARK